MAVRPSMELDARARPINVKGRLGLQMKGAMTRTPRGTWTPRC